MWIYRILNSLSAIVSPFTAVQWYLTKKNIQVYSVRVLKQNNCHFILDTRSNLEQWISRLWGEACFALHVSIPTYPKDCCLDNWGGLFTSAYPSIANTYAVSHITFTFTSLHSIRWIVPNKHEHNYNNVCGNGNRNLTCTTSRPPK